ncbi:putative DNA-binding WGR domain protein [Rhizobium leguminosarum]|nr:putative DNA-binding WGR domain protein [Rhizobium leguminosarum]
MTPATHPTLLFHVDPARNMARFYLLAVEPTLFGGSSLTRCWGRMGTKGQMKIDLFDTAVEAKEASRKLLHGKLKRGYQRNEENSDETGSEPVGTQGRQIDSRGLSRDQLGNEIAGQSRQRQTEMAVAEGIGDAGQTAGAADHWK